LPGRFPNILSRESKNLQETLGPPLILFWSLVFLSNVFKFFILALHCSQSLSGLSSHTQLEHFSLSHSNRKKSHSFAWLFQLNLDVVHSNTDSIVFLGSYHPIV
jgi:hypothetical protein